MDTMKKVTTASSQQSNIEITAPKKIRHSIRQPVKLDNDKAYLSDRSSYHSKYYQTNKKRIKAQKAKRYEESEEVREYHRKKSNEWYKRNKVKAGKNNRTIVQTGKGQRLYSIRHAATSLGISVSYFRDLIREGIVPEASYRAIGNWRMYTKDQLRLLQRASDNYYQYTTPYRMQAVLFCFWEKPDVAMKSTPDACLIQAVKWMEKTALRADEKTVQLRAKF